MNQKNSDQAVRGSEPDKLQKEIAAAAFLNCKTISGKIARVGKIDFQKSEIRQAAKKLLSESVRNLNIKLHINKEIDMQRLCVPELELHVKNLSEYLNFWQDKGINVNKVKRLQGVIINLKQTESKLQAAKMIAARKKAVIRAVEFQKVLRLRDYISSLTSNAPRYLQGSAEDIPEDLIMFEKCTLNILARYRTHDLSSDLYNDLFLFYSRNKEKILSGWKNRNNHEVKFNTFLYYCLQRRYFRLINFLPMIH